MKVCVAALDTHQTVPAHTQQHLLWLLTVHLEIEWIGLSHNSSYIKLIMVGTYFCTLGYCMSLIELVESLCLSFRWRGHMLSTQSIRSTYTEIHKTREKRQWEKQTETEKEKDPLYWFSEVTHNTLSTLSVYIPSFQTNYSLLECVDVLWRVSWPGSPT